MSDVRPGRLAVLGRPRPIPRTVSGVCVRLALVHMLLVLPTLTTQHVASRASINYDTSTESPRNMQTHPAGTDSAVYTQTPARGVTGDTGEVHLSEVRNRAHLWGTVQGSPLG